MAKIRNVKITYKLSGMGVKYRPLYEKVFEDITRVLSSSHWDDSFKASIKAYKTRLAGELNPKLKKMSDADIALLIFDKVYTDDTGITWHCITDYDVRTYNGPSNVIGYGLGSDDITRVNTDFLGNLTHDDTAKGLKNRRERGENLVHEKFHDRGASHDSRSTSRRPNSIAYLSGTTYEIAFDKVFKEKLDDLEPVKTTPPEKVPDAPAIPPEVTETPVAEPVKVKICKPWYDPSWWFNPDSRCQFLAPEEREK